MLIGLGSCVSNSSACTPTETDGVRLRGTIRIEEHFGPPNFGETPEIDERRRVAILYLDRRLSVCPSATETVHQDGLVGVTKVQLALPTSVKAAAGTEVEAAGKLVRSENAFHYTDVVMLVDHLTVKSD